MPELPEVEILRLQLSKLIIGKTIKSIAVFHTKSFIGDKRYVTGEKIIGVRRFAKILVIDLSNGLSLAVHLKMSGQLIFKANNSQHLTFNKKIIDSSLQFLPNRHTRVVIHFTNRDKLFFNDQRKFGWMKIVQRSKFKVQNDNLKFKIGKLEDLIKNLGPEPLRDLTLAKFKEILKSSRRPVKLILMDQEKISGVGNIYTNDALFLAGIDPRRKASKLSDSHTMKLYRSLLKVLADGIKWKGASRNHFRDVFGEKGEVQEHFHVYDREGEKCPNNCGGIIKRIKLGGRGTFFCSRCQT